MRISLFIPCYNEEKSIRQSINSWLKQTRPADEIIVVNDSSTDRTLQILQEFGDQIKVVTTPKNTGNKSHAQEYGLPFVTGDVFVTTDGDTLLHPDFIKRIEKDFSDPTVAAVGGQVKSLKYNWLTTCRALEYVIGHSIDKLAQNYLGYIFVIPGAAAAFRTSIFKSQITFDHDTITEDLDFTYKLHRLGHKITYDAKAICFTQDPSDLKSYINQIRRWYGGGWQTLLKYLEVPQKPAMALEWTLIHTEGLIFSFLLFLMPFLNLTFALVFFASYCVIAFIMAVVGLIKEGRWDFFAVLPLYVLIKYLNAYIYLEQFVKEVLLKQRNLIWIQPDRVSI